MSKIECQDLTLRKFHTIFYFRYSKHGRQNQSAKFVSSSSSNRAQKHVQVVVAVFPEHCKSREAKQDESA